jgi:AraC-like DNA-binding protein
MSRAQPNKAPSTATVTMNVAHALLGYAASRGHDFEGLARRFELPAGDLANVEARLPVQTAQRLWAELPALLDDDNLGIHLAEHLSPFGGLLPILQLTSAPTLGDGLARVLDQQRVLAEGSTWRRTRPSPEREVYLYEFSDPIAAAPRHALEFGLALLVLVGRRVISDELNPLELRFRHAAPVDPREHDALFRCRLVYGQARDEIHLSTALLDLPVRTANPALLAHLDAHAKKQLEALAPDETLSGRVRHALRKSLADEPSLESVASAIGCAPRTLQRKLRDAGTSLQTLLDQVRYERACELLRDRAVGLRAVSIELGFSEQAAFHRAFVRWSGVAPGRWRARELG